MFPSFSDRIRNQSRVHDIQKLVTFLQTFLIPDLYYDGLGPDAYFRVGTGPEPDASIKNPPGMKIPNERGRFVFDSCSVFLLRTPLNGRRVDNSH